MVSKKVYPRLLEPPEGSFFLFGARGTGKSTWLKATFPRAMRIDLLDLQVYQDLLADPGLLGRKLRALTPGSTIVLDEIQRLPVLLNEVHRFMEEQGHRFVLCGSSARKLKKQGTNLLAGRAVRRFMFPFLPAELDGDFDLEEVLRYGALPVVWQAADKADTLAAYVQMYLKEEIQAEALVRNLPGFARFLPVLALFHAQVLNLSSLARDAGVARTTVQGYLEIAEDTLITFKLPSFPLKEKVRERKHPKLYWVDPGLPRAVRGALGPPGPEEKGALLEGWVAVVLRAYKEYRKLFDDWGHWSVNLPSRKKVDFLLRRGEEKVAIEVKSADRFQKSHASGLRALGDLPGLARKILVYLGRDRQKTEDGIEILPLSDFLQEVDQGGLWKNP